MPDTTPTPAPEPMGGAPDLIEALGIHDREGGVVWVLREAAHRIEEANALRNDGYLASTATRLRREANDLAERAARLRSTPTAPPSAACPECGEGAPGYTVLYGKGGEPEQEQCRTCFERPAPPATGTDDGLRVGVGGESNGALSYRGARAGSAQAGIEGATPSPLLDTTGNPVPPMVGESLMPAPPATGGRDAERVQVMAGHVDDMKRQLLRERERIAFLLGVEVNTEAYDAAEDALNARMQEAGHA